MDNANADTFEKFETLSDAGKLYGVGEDPRLINYWFQSPVDAARCASGIPGAKVFAQAEHRRACREGTAYSTQVAT